jgi:LPXTG-motif cell wall-anchored protein
MKIPSVPKGFVGFPLVIVLVAVGALYIWRKKKE